MSAHVAFKQKAYELTPASVSAQPLCICRMQRVLGEHAACAQGTSDEHLRNVWEVVYVLHAMYCGHPWLVIMQFIWASMRTA